MVLDFKEDVDFWDKSNIVVVDLRMANQDTKKMIPLLLAIVHISNILKIKIRLLPILI